MELNQLITDFQKKFEFKINGDLLESILKESIPSAISEYKDFCSQEFGENITQIQDIQIKAYQYLEEYLNSNGEEIKPKPFKINNVLKNSKEYKVQGVSIFFEYHTTTTQIDHKSEIFIFEKFEHVKTIDNHLKVKVHFKYDKSENQEQKQSKLSNEFLDIVTNEITNNQTLETSTIRDGIKLSLKQDILKLFIQLQLRSFLKSEFELELETIKTFKKENPKIDQDLLESILKYSIPLAISKYETFLRQIDKNQNLKEIKKDAYDYLKEYLKESAEEIKPSIANTRAFYRKFNDKSDKCNVGNISISFRYCTNSKIHHSATKKFTFKEFDIKDSDSNATNLNVTINFEYTTNSNDQEQIELFNRFLDKITEKINNNANVPSNLPIKERITSFFTKNILSLFIQTHLRLFLNKEFTEFITFTHDIFRINQADLDFGLYRILNIKRTLILNFLEDDIKTIFEDTFEKFQQEDQQKEIIIRDALNRLIEFFKRYYDQGDFISQRRYTYDKSTYVVPYNGEEVKLHWANSDQFYVKTTENFKNYQFKHPKSINHLVCFEILDATTEQNNNKSSKQKERKFKLASSNLIKVIKQKDFDDQEKTVLMIYFEYDFDDDKQNTLFDKAFDEICKTLNRKPKDFDGFLDLLTSKKEESKIFQHLRTFFAKNTFDFFIHKDLKSFLNRELDFYLKNEIVNLNGLNTENDFKSILVKMKLIKDLADPIIELLSQIEDFQKKLYLKKKMVVECHYCITIDRILKITDQTKKDKIIEQILAKKEQLAEWKSLFYVHEIQGDLTKSGFQEKIDAKFLEENQFLLIDTRFFDRKFKWMLLSSIDGGIDEQCDGLMINGDNFQVLNLLGERYREKIKCIYIDPPYNTGEDGFIYKDKYKSSSWLSFMNDRFLTTINFMSYDGLKFISISDDEQSNLKILLDQIYGFENYIGTIEWNSTKSVTNTALLSVSHTHNFIYSKNIDYFIKNRKHFRLPDSIEGFNNPDQDSRGPWKADPFQVGGERPNQLYEIINPITKVSYKPNDGCSWKNDYETYLKLLQDNRIIFGVSGEAGPQRKRFWCEAEERGRVSKTWWDEVETTTNGTQMVKNIFGKHMFTNPKPIGLIKKILQLGLYNNTQQVLDYFAGSGTTGHAVIDLNREDQGKRKYILVEMGEYFTTVTKPRIQKVIYSKDWKDGKPQDRQGISHCFKYFDIESYEDTLNNIHLTSKLPSQLQYHPTLSKEYLLKYMLNHESQECLFNIQNFERPFEYELEITRLNEKKSTKVDLIETFNYLVGIEIEKYHQYDFNNDEFYMIEGKIKNKKTLIIWRSFDIKSDQGKAAFIVQNENLNQLLSTSLFQSLFNDSIDIMINGDHLLGSLLVHHQTVNENDQDLEKKYLGDSTNNYIYSIEHLFYLKMFEAN
jgi:adenine-specific DNA-methyltransferase